MKYKITLLAMMFLGCSTAEPEPEFIRPSDREIELIEKIIDETNKVCIGNYVHCRPDPQTVKNLRQHKIELMELQKSH
jgi:hypothetical protein